MLSVADTNRCVWQLFNIVNEKPSENICNIASFPKTLYIMILSGLSYLFVGHNKKIIGRRSNVPQIGPRC